MQVSEFGVLPRLLAPSRAFAAHSVPIGEPGLEVECRAWHIANQVAAWHHETVLFTYQPAPGKGLDESIVALLDSQIQECHFDRVLAQQGPQDSAESKSPKPWWKVW